MKRILALLCAVMLCTCLMALAACGGSSASSGASASTSASSAQPATATFVGTWKLAGAESQGVTVAGDLSAMLGTNTQIEMVLQDGGTGSMSYAGETVNLTWTESGENAIKVTPQKEDSASAASASAAASDASASAAAESAAGDAAAGSLDRTFEATYEDGKLTIKNEEGGQTVTMLFTQDGTLPGMVDISMGKATPITSEADLLGDWKFSGLNMMGAIMTGESEALAQISGGSAQLAMSFAEGGKGNMGGQEFTYSVTADGATATIQGTTVPIMMLDGNLVMDLGGTSGITMIIMYSK